METDKKMAFKYLSNFKKEEVEVLLKEFEQYIKFSNGVRTPLIFVFVIGGIMRTIKNNMPSNRSILIVAAIGLLMALFIWLIVIGYKIIKQKKLVKHKLKSMANVQNYPFKEVKKEFNALVKEHYKGHKL